MVGAMALAAVMSGWRMLEAVEVGVALRGEYGAGQGME